MTTADILGRFLWHDLMTTDQDAAGAFYPKVTGWKSQPWENDSSYQIWVTPKGASGGTAALTAEAQSAGTHSHWLAYVGTPDIESTVETAQKLGAKVLKEISDVPDVGRFAVLADPQGAMFAVYTPESAKDGADETGGGFSWHELATSDLDAAWEFYSELFGWDKEGAHDMGAGVGTYLLFGQGGKQIGGIYKVSSDASTPPHWLCYASVSSVSEAAEAAKAAGGQVVNGPMEVPGGDWVAQVIDPQGAAFAVHESRQAAAKPKRAKKSKPAAPKASPAEAAAPAAVADEPADEAPASAKPERKAPARSKKKAAAKSKQAPAKAAAKGKGAAKKAPAKSKAAAKSKGKPAAAKKAAVPKKAAAKKAAAKKAVAKKAAPKKASQKKVAALKKSAAPKKAVAKKKAAPTKVVGKKKAPARKK